MNKKEVEFAKPSKARLMELKDFIIADYAKDLEKAMGLTGEEARKMSMEGIAGRLDGEPETIDLHLIRDKASHVEIGYIWFRIGNNFLYISDIYIQERHRHQGFGTTVMDQLVADHEGKFKYLQLHVFHFNETAIRFYRKYGFTVTGSYMLKKVAEG